MRTIKYRNKKHRYILSGSKENRNKENIIQIFVSCQLQKYVQMQCFLCYLFAWLDLSAVYIQRIPEVEKYSPWKLNAPPYAPPSLSGDSARLGGHSAHYGGVLGREGYRKALECDLVSLPKFCVSRSHLRRRVFGNLGLLLDLITEMTFNISTWINIDISLHHNTKEENIFHNQIIKWFFKKLLIKLMWWKELMIMIKI